MKKFFLIISIILLTAGCSSNLKVETVTCNGTNQSDEYNIKFNYNISYKGNYITKVKSTEEVVLSDPSKIEEYKKILVDTYEPYDKLDYYTNIISVENDTITSETIINYEKVNTDKLIDIDENNSSVISNGKIKVQTLVELYEKQGATCK